MAGVITSDTNELVQHFPGNYKDKSKIIVSVFLARHLASLGVTLTDKKIAHNDKNKLFFLPLLRPMYLH